MAKEKLREYLRNNRLRDKENLGNAGSINEENYTKSLKNNLNSGDLNLNNDSNSKTLKDSLDNSQISNNKTNSNKRDYDKEPIVIKDYSYFFGVSLKYFSVTIGITFIFYIFYIVVNPMKEKIEILILFVLMIVPLVFVFYNYYAHVVKDNYTLYFTNNSINYMLDGKLKRKIDINEIPNYLLKPFWKNRFDTELAIFILVILVFIVSLWLIYATKPFPKEIYYFIVLWLASKLFANIVFKASLYLWLNKTLSGFRIFPILIIAEPIIDPKSGTGIWLSNQKYYFIYFYNEQIYDEVREYFLQNLGFDIDKTKKLITF